jgi:hypothetical protein
MKCVERSDFTSDRIVRGGIRTEEPARPTREPCIRECTCMQRLSFSAWRPNERDRTMRARALDEALNLRMRERIVSGEEHRRSSRIDLPLDVCIKATWTTRIVWRLRHCAEGTCAKADRGHIDQGRRAHVVMLLRDE